MFGMGHWFQPLKSHTHQTEETPWICPRVISIKTTEAFRFTNPQKGALVGEASWRGAHITLPCPALTPVSSWAQCVEVSLRYGLPSLSFYSQALVRGRKNPVSCRRQQATSWPGWANA